MYLHLVQIFVSKGKGQGHSRRRHIRQRQPIEFRLVSYNWILDLSIFKKFYWNEIIYKANA